MRSTLPDPSSKPAPVVALAGRRIDAADATVKRFALQDVDVVRERMRSMLKEVQPAKLVCSAACGADLLALDEAAELGIPRQIVLPNAKARFRETSVVDRPGNWGWLFDRLVAEAEADNAILIANVPDNDDGYLEVNRAILNEAQRVASTGTDVEAWIVWNGQPRDAGDVTLHFADQALKRGLFVRVISTLPESAVPTAPDHTKTCFVVMPFRIKLVNGEMVPFDALFDTILAPAIRSVCLPDGDALLPYRTDRDLAPGLIDRAMFEHLEYSRFVFCDLTGLNPNVMFELGMRFHARASGTVLFRQPGTPLPFDITGVKVFEYDTREPKTARRLIQQVLSEALHRNQLDSPIRRVLDQRVAESHELLDHVLREAEAALACGDLAGARAKFAQAARLRPDDAVVRLRLATLEKLRRERNWPAILAEAMKATQIAPDYAEAWRERGIAEGQIWRSAEDKSGLADGVDSLERAIGLNPQDFDARASLGGILRRQGKLKEAYEQYRASVEVSEGHPYPLLNVIKLEVDLFGQVDLARYQRNLATAARIREPQTKAAIPADVPWSFFDLTEIRLYQGRPDEAVGVLRDGSDLYGREQLAQFRGLLFGLRKADPAVPGLEQLIEAADELRAD